MKIASIDKDVESLFSSNYYRVPRFQRPYSWDEANVEEFYRDTIVESSEDYFIGSVVLYKEKNDTFGIVDGQQRLTTITIALCVIRNAFESNGFNDLALGVHSLVERSDRQNVKQFVLQTETAYPYFHEYIQKFDKPEVQKDSGDEEKRLEKSFELLTKEVSQAVEAILEDSSLRADVKRRRIAARLTEIRDSILRLKIIVIELDNEDDAYLIFETLNTRGKDLAVSDLVKNHLTRNLKKKNGGVDIARDRWREIREKFDASQVDLDVNRFLHHSWLSRNDYTTEKRLFKAIKKNVVKVNAKPFLDSLISDADLYRVIHEPSVRSWRLEEIEIKDSLDALNLFNVRQQIPLVLAIVRNYQEKKLNGKQTRDALWAIEAFYFLFTAITDQRPSGGFGMMLARLARELEAANGSQAKALVIQEIKSRLRETKPSSRLFEYFFAQLRYSEAFTRQKKIVQYALRKIAQKSAPHGVLDFSRMNIEHIRPQSSGANEDLAVLAAMGNLALVNHTANAESLGSKPFTKKKAVLVSAMGYSDTLIANATEWSQLQIELRTAAMAEFSYKNVWTW